MAETSPLNNLRRLREAKGLSQTKLAVRAGTTAQQIDRLEKGQRKLTKEWAERLAPHLEVAAQAILFDDATTRDISKAGDRNEELLSFFVDVPVMGVVEAGSWREIPSDEGAREVVRMLRDTRFPPDVTEFALRVRGDSMDAAKDKPITEGALIRCISWGDIAYRARTGLLVVVRRWDGSRSETTVKRLVVNRTTYELRPESTNPMHKPIVIPRETDELDQSGGVEIIGLVTSVTYETEI